MSAINIHLNYAQGVTLKLIFSALEVTLDFTDARFSSLEINAIKLKLLTQSVRSLSSRTIAFGR